MELVVLLLCAIPVAWVAVIVVNYVKGRWIALFVGVVAPSMPLLAHWLSVEFAWLRVEEGWAPTFAADVAGVVVGTVLLIGTALVAVFGRNRRHPDPSRNGAGGSFPPPVLSSPGGEEAA